MRRIQKIGQGTDHLARKHANPPATKEQATSRWQGFGGRKQLQNAHLLAEQFMLCCYSEVRADQLGIGYHIEHVENKSQAPGRTFDYANLAASAFDSDGLMLAKRQGWEVFGGHAPKKQGRSAPVDMHLFVSPHKPDSAGFFAYLSNGAVVARLGLNAVDTQRANYTIDLLNLNSPYLVSLRKSWWDELDQWWQKHVQEGWSVQHLMEVDLLPSSQGLSPFFSLTRQFYGSAAEEWLSQQAPELL